MTDALREETDNGDELSISAEAIDMVVTPPPPPPNVGSAAFGMVSVAVLFAAIAMSLM